MPVLHLGSPWGRSYLGAGRGAGRGVGRGTLVGGKTEGGLVTAELQHPSCLRDF